MSYSRTPRSPVRTFARSFLSLIKSAFSCSPSHESLPETEPLNPSIPPPRSRIIGNPRQLRRVVLHNGRGSHIHFINRLPVEIISHIFVIASEQDSLFPITISHVCGAWRHIALRTPALWRRITLGPEEIMWRERIHRARACSLDIQLLPWRTGRNGSRRPLDLTPYTAHWYMQMAIPYIRQWRSLEICFAESSPYLWKAALAGCAVPAPLLEEMSLTYRRNDDTHEFLLFSAYSPRLRRLTVDGIRLAWIPSLFGNLTYLDYTHPGFTSGHQAVHDVISILTVTTRLTEFRVLFPRGQTVRLPSRRDVVTKRIALPLLRQLVLRVDGSDIPFELAHLVTLISSPFLSSLRLIDLRRERHSFPSLKSFFYVYALPPNLHFVYIGHAWYDPRMIHAMTHSLSQLSRIVVKRSRVPEQVLNVSRTKREYNSRSLNRAQGQISHRQYHIDRLNVQYFPRGSSKA